VATAALLFGPVSGAVADTPTPEYQVKAVFLLHFAQFVDWPDQAFGDSQTPLSICVLGEDPFDGYLDDTVRGEKVNERSFVVRRSHNLGDMAGCHILYISSSEVGRLKQDIAAVKGQSVLTVSDSDGFDRLGGMIGFTLADSRVRLEINPDAAKAANLKLSSKLLQAARIVGSGGN
jgi:hypothetical protein